MSPLNDPALLGDDGPGPSSPDCRAASSGSWGAAHPAPLSSHAAKGESPSQHFPFEEPQVEGGVGCDPGWLALSGLLVSL